MLAKPYRITLDRDFTNVKKNGKVFNSQNFTLAIFDREEGEFPRFGFVIPNKVVANAVDRNRIKRVLSESTRFQLKFIKPTVDCVFLPKPSILTAYTADVMKEVEKAFQNADITKPV